ncbi:MAG: right-handed parallel beta-helix repeat-containing protein [Candidatus Bathyarchaeota archaeon]|nr:NosD domain-containing protein [Candidatus Bathyarchaeum tardum]WGM89762.1 MAG: NosD domain-containing protein [Candidatus Bathyarchaeum tardum]WNZ30144.1 MAG: right-handed parallel beta-helix repeat-containing protein [Candidatus Bathyarchaeota archaeon]
MTKNASRLILLLLFCSSWLVVIQFPLVNAETKTIVVPDDYDSIQDAIIAANVGDTVFVKNGVYPVDENASIIVYKTVSIIGEDPKNTMIQGNYSNIRGGTAIRVAAPDVTISGFTITDCRVAITIVNYSGEPHPSGCKIINNNIVNNSEGIRPRANNVLISGNNITNCGTGISGYDTKSIVIIGNNITENTYGINIGQSNYITVTENNISSNEGGLNMIYYGPYSVYGNNFTKNDWAIRFAEGCRNAEVYGNNISENSIAVWLLTFPVGGEMAIRGEGNKFFGNLLVGNTQQISTHEIKYGNYNPTNKGTDIVAWDNSTIGNYWSDYDGIDENGDNIGDTPYILDENNQDNHPLTKQIDIKTIPENNLTLFEFLGLGTILLVIKMVFKKAK